MVSVIKVTVATSPATRPIHGGRSALSTVDSLLARSPASRERAAPRQAVRPAGATDVTVAGHRRTGGDA